MKAAFFRITLFSLAVLPFLMGSGAAMVTAQSAATDTPTPKGADVTLPELTGRYKVGRLAYEWIDPNRDETYASVPGLKRDLMVDIWFPADPAKRAKIVPYMEDSAMWDLVTKHPELENSIHVHAYYTNAVAADQPTYPLLVFEADQDVVTFYYTSILEELASQGYVVIGMTHPYSTAAISYPDGRLVVAGTVASAFPLAAANGKPNDKVLGQWTQDVSFVLDQMAALNASDPIFKGRLDLGHIGIFGHAVGGSAATKTAATEPRIQAVASLDGLGSSDSLQKPFLVMGFDAPPSATQQGKDTYWFTSSQLTFINYGDFTLLPPLVSVQGFTNSGGAIDPARGVQMINGELVAFFNHYLKGMALNWPDYAEAKIVGFGTNK